DDAASLLRFLPPDMVEQFRLLSDPMTVARLTEVVLDERRRPFAVVGGQRLFLWPDEPSKVVMAAQLAALAAALEADGTLGPDRWCGFDGHLGRVSVLRNGKGAVSGLSFRVGRYVRGVADHLADLFLGSPPPPVTAQQTLHPPRSILVLGARGAGKTTVLRDVCRRLSEVWGVMVVDTAGQICGDGDVPHEASVGLSRRMVVAEREAQHKVMLKTLQNHTPDVIVVDEIAGADEAAACAKIRSRGVCLIAGA
ncbi:unnamed protein product, partial [Phaeothamnion confervicola]